MKGAAHVCFIAVIVKLLIINVHVIRDATRQYPREKLWRMIILSTRLCASFPGHICSVGTSAAEMVRMMCCQLCQPFLISYFEGSYSSKLAHMGPVHLYVHFLVTG